MIQLLRALPAPAEDADLVPSTSIKQCTVTCNLHPVGSTSLLWSLQALQSYAHTQLSSLKRADVCFGHHSLLPSRNQRLLQLKSSQCNEVKLRGRRMLRLQREEVRCGIAERGHLGDCSVGTAWGQGMGLHLVCRSKSPGIHLNYYHAEVEKNLVTGLKKEGQEAGG